MIFAEQHVCRFRYLLCQYIDLFLKLAKALFLIMNNRDAITNLYSRKELSLRSGQARFEREREK